MLNDDCISQIIQQLTVKETSVLGFTDKSHSESKSIMYKLRCAKDARQFLKYINTYLGCAEDIIDAINDPEIHRYFNLSDAKQCIDGLESIYNPYYFKQNKTYHTCDGIFTKNEKGYCVNMWMGLKTVVLPPHLFKNISQQTRSMLLC